MSEAAAELPEPLSGSRRKVLLALDKIGAHDAVAACTAEPVARRIGYSELTVTALLGRLCVAGLAERQPGPGGWYYWLTTEGLEAARQQETGG